MDPHSRAPKKNTSHGNEVLPQDTMYLIQIPCYLWGCLCQDPANKLTKRRPNHCKEMQAAVIWSCLLFIRSGQNHLARHSERRKKTRPTKKEMGRQHQGMDRPRVRQVPEGSGEQGKMGKTGCEIICGAPTTLAVKGLMMMMMMMQYHAVAPHFNGLYSSLELCCECPWFTSIQEDGCDKGAHRTYPGTERNTPVIVNDTVVCAILESTWGLEPSSVKTEPRYLKLVTVSSFCPFNLCVDATGVDFH